jgi:hypothetical protein
MKIQKRFFTALAVCLGLACLINPIQTARAGWTGYLTGSGSGWAYTSVSPWIQVTTSTGLVYYTNGPAAAIKTPSVLNPGAFQASTTPDTDTTTTTKYSYTLSRLLPTGASANTIARAVGATGAVWVAYTAGYNGDRTDNQELQNRVKIKPAPCPELGLDTLLTAFDEENGNGEITVKTFGTGGTALWLRGFEITPDMIVPEDDINTPNNETTDWLKEFASLRFENLIIGPFEYGFNGKCELIIHFTLESKDIENLAFVTDGAALSEPIAIENCPAPATVVCGQEYVYPTVTAKGGCGALTISYSPAVEDLVLGVNTVTVTATDTKGDSRSCTFTVTVLDSTAPVPPTLTDVNVTCGTPVTLPAPKAWDSCVGWVTGTTTTRFPIESYGTHTVVWTFDDGHGNVSTASQNVNVTGLNFVGFYAPLGTIGGDCKNPAKNVKLGSVIPIKFDVKCGSTVITTGPAPTIRVEKWNPATSTTPCAFDSVPLTMTAVYQNDWHANWDTTLWTKGLYKIVVTVQDGSSFYVFVNLR